jgi:hypothetical protein
LADLKRTDGAAARLYFLVAVPGQGSAAGELGQMPIHCTKLDWLLNGIPKKIEAIFPTHWKR